MPFFEAKFTEKEDGNVKSTLYRKNTDTDLNFTSHHPKAPEVSQNPYEQV